MPGFDHSALRQTVLSAARSVIANAAPARLVEDGLRQPDTMLSEDGALVARTGAFTGRSPKDKFIVRDALTENRVWWDNSGALAREKFDVLLADALAHLAGQAIYAQDLLAGAEPGRDYQVSVLTPSAWHALFIRNLLIRPQGKETAGAARQVTIVHAPEMQADPARHGTRTTTAIALDMSRDIVVIAGTLYAGEIKKSVFSLFNFHAPAEDVLPMHCSANVGAGGDVALFFGLSGTGKTTLSNDPARPLIGDDEHGWSARGVFNLEGGCYAKTVKLSAEAEPEIFAATKRFGTVLENVVLDAASRRPDFDDISLTENTRAAYPIDVLPAVVKEGRGGVPRHVVFLTADAFGVLPPIAKARCGAGGLSLPVGLHRQGGRHRARGDRAAGDVLGLLRGAVHAAASAGLWRDAEGAAGRERGAVLAAQHRLDRWRARRGAAHRHQVDPGAAERGAERGAGRCRDAARCALRAGGAGGGRGRGGGAARSAFDLGDAAAYDETAERLAGLFRRNFEKFGPEADGSAGPKLLAAE
jgi:phosphoenolpyruvate carboxykinase (ATP)